MPPTTPPTMAPVLGFELAMDFSLMAAEEDAGKALVGEGSDEVNTEVEEGGSGSGRANRGLPSLQQLPTSPLFRYGLQQYTSRLHCCTSTQELGLTSP